MFRDYHSPKRTEILVYISTWFLYCGQACVFPHLTRYYDLDLHLSDWEIGLMMSLTALSGVLLQPFWGILADRGFGRTKTLRLALTFNIVFLIAFTFAYPIGGFSLLLLTGILFSTGYYAGLPLSSAIILSYLGKQRRHLFGRIRVIGSISFTVGMFLICPIMVHLSLQFGLYGRTLVFLTACLFYLITIFSTFWNEAHFEKHQKPKFHNFMTLIRNSNLQIFYLSIFCVSIGAAAGIQYIGPYIGHRGLSERFFSTLWLVGVGMEILLTFNLHHVARRLGLKYTIAIGFAAEGLRWFGFSFIETPGWILLLNCLHGPSVLGIFFASAMYLDTECEENVRSTAQALLYVSFVAGQVTGYVLSSAIVNYYSDLPRVQAIQFSFLWSSLFALTAAVFATLFLRKEFHQSP